MYSHVKVNYCRNCINIGPSNQIGSFIVSLVSLLETPQRLDIIVLYVM